MKRALAAFALVVASLAGVTGPAQASTVGNVYIAFPKSQGNCPEGGSVMSVWAENGLQTWNWDRGDDTIYGKVNLGRTNTIRYELLCVGDHWWEGWYYQPRTETSFVPTRSGQTVWVGPSGSTHN